MTDRLTIVLDRLLPGDADRGWPAAGSLGLAATARRLAEGRGDTDALEATLGGLPATFDTLADVEQTAALAALERDQPDAFARLLLYAYGAYYTDPRVRAVVETRTGYPARPPQPEGYDLPPFDESLLGTVRQRTPFWRRTDA